MDNITADPPEELWLQNELYSLKKEDQEVFLSKQEWLNDRIMDTAQKLIMYRNWYQSVLNSQKAHYHYNQLHKTMFNFFTIHAIIS